MIKTNTLIPALLTSIALTMGSALTHADSLADLLNQVKSGNFDKSENAAELERAYAAAGDKAAFVQQLNQQRSTLEAQSESLEDQFNSNEELLNQLRNRKEAELGDLANLFGLIEQSASEAKAIFDTSIVSAQYPERSAAVDAIAKKISQTNDLVTLEEMETVWQEMLTEMVEQGRVVTFEAPVATTDGNKANTSVSRIGTFNLVANGKFLEYGASGIAELPRQPAGRFLGEADSLQAATSGLVAFPVDPTRGALLGAAVESPSLAERVEQGGLVGYIILGVGALAVVFALFKIVTLTLIGAAVDKQAKDTSNPSDSNPLGRVLAILGNDSGDNTDALEMKLSESIMAETPKLNSGLMFLKIVSVVAPLAGLLGTVLGMIQTFQAITLFGAGDPKLMAGGISQALVTTVCGLVVAIPVVLLHTAAASRAKRIEEVLEEQATGMVARRLEAKN